MPPASDKVTTRATKTQRRAVGQNDVADPRPMEEDPESLLSKTSTTLDEQEALRAVTYNTVDLGDLEERIGLASRIIIEHTLRSRGGMSKKDKCDIALRAITTLEGSKQEVVWRDKRLKAPSRTTTVALKAEKEKVANRLIKVALRNKELQIAHAEEALKGMGEKPKGEN